jgi:hypothetical protein
LLFPGKGDISTRADNRSHLITTRPKPSRNIGS